MLIIDSRAKQKLESRSEKSFQGSGDRCGEQENQERTEAQNASDRM
jgi:hypothetical protein